MNSHTCTSSTPGSLAGAADASKTTEQLSNKAVYSAVQSTKGNAPLRFSSYAERAAYYRGKVACNGGTPCDEET